MELANTETVSGQVQTSPRLMDNPIARQLGVMIGIAASVALGVAVVLWSQTPNYSLLYGSLSQKDAAEVIESLQQAGIAYKVDGGSGAVMVPSSDLHQARMKLAGKGLPQSDGMGFELLQQDTGFGTSRTVEAARYQRALEGELARTIATLTNVERARVHLATPKQSVFVRKRKHPSASVTLKLYSGRTLEKGQVESIVHLVASSVPELQPGRVTVVDQKGRLLNSEKDSRDMQLTATQFEYTRELEKHYKKRIEDILAPIIGQDRVRAEVTAEVDFTITEQTQEQFNPDLPALRSEQINEQSSRLGATQGVPGALSNQPPAAGTAPQVAGGAGAGDQANEPLNSSRRATRNYELDKTISHTRLSTGDLRRLSVAVVVDDQVTVAEDSTVTRTPRTEEDITRITNLVREAVGFSTQRGDSVRVINSSFMVPAPLEPLPELAIWEQSWFWDVLKQAGGVLVVLLLIFGVLRPTMKRLTTPVAVSVNTAGSVNGNQEEGGSADGGVAGAPQLGADGQVKLPGPGGYEQTLDAARGLVTEDPKRVAQVVKSWVGEDGGK